MDNPQTTDFEAGEGMRITGWLLWMVAVGLAIWAILSPSSVSVSEADALLSRLDPAAHPLPGAVSNLALMQKKLLLFLGAGFTGLIGTGLYCCGVMVLELAKHGSVKPDAAPTRSPPEAESPAT